MNRLINSSKKVNKEVVFIYAVRDEMFVDKDRTKFFDFIIPIIPIVNSSNSKEVLLEKLPSENNKISEDLLDDISYFLDDMRVLHNISNEFKIYKLNLSEKLTQDKLLSLIVYKNIYPNDFVLLSRNEGDLYKAISQRSSFINSEVLKIDETINNLKLKIKIFELNRLKDVKELKILYLYKYIQNLPHFISFVINGNCLSLSDVLDDDWFDYFVKDQAQFQTQHSGYAARNIAIPVKFSVIESEVDSHNTYGDRKEIIEKSSNGMVSKFKIKIEELTKERTSISHLRLKDILSREGVSSNLGNSSQSQLISILLKFGYIDEDYLDYISIFYEGSIAKSDHQFLLNIKTEIITSYDHPLSKIKNLIGKIRPQDFGKHYIFNYDLLKFILQSEEFVLQSELMFQHLSNESDNSIRFIEGVIDNNISVEKFFLRLCNAWPKIWVYIQTESSFTNERKEKYLLLIVNHGDIQSLQKICKLSTLAQDVSKMKDLLQICGDIHKFHQVLNALSIKFETLEKLSSLSVEIIDIIYGGNHYVISASNIIGFIKYKSQFDQHLYDTKNYFYINSIGCNELSKYVEGNIALYLSNVYLATPATNYEDQAFLIKLLNNPVLSIKQKDLVLQKTGELVDSIETIEDLELCDLIIVRNKIKATWENLITYYARAAEEVSDVLIGFVNNRDNAQILSNANIDHHSCAKEVIDAFVVSLLLADGIEYSCYVQWTKPISDTFFDLDFSELTESKVEYLVRSRKIGLSEDSFSQIKNKFPNITSILIEIWFSDIIKAFSSYSLSENDYFKILDSKALSTIDKNTFLSVADENTIIGSNLLLFKLGMLHITNRDVKISSNLFPHVFSNSTLSVEQKVVLLNYRADILDPLEVKTFVSSLPYPYNDIAINGKRPSLMKTATNAQLVNNLQDMGLISRYRETDDKIKIYTFTK